MFWLDLLCPVSSLTLWLSKPSSLPEVPWSPQRCAAQSQNRQWELEKRRVERQRLPGVSVGSTPPHIHLHFRCTPRLPAAHPALAPGTPQVSSGEKWSISCHGSKQGGHSQPSNVSASAPRILRKEKNTFHLPAIRLQPLPPVSPKEAQDVKTQDTGPRLLRFIQKEWSQQAQTLASFHTQKNTKFLNLGYLCMLSLFSCVRLFATLWTVSHQAPLSMGFSRQEYCSGLPFPSPR